MFLCIGPIRGMVKVTHPYFYSVSAAHCEVMREEADTTEGTGVSVEDHCFHSWHETGPGPESRPGVGNTN